MLVKLTFIVLVIVFDVSNDYEKNSLSDCHDHKQLTFCCFFTRKGRVDCLFQVFSKSLFEESYI